MKYVFTLIVCLFLSSMINAINPIEEVTDGVVLSVNKDPSYQYEITSDNKMHLRRGGEILYTYHINFSNRFENDYGYINYVYKTPYSKEIYQINILDLRPMRPKDRKMLFGWTSDIIITFNHTSESGKPEENILASVKSGDLGSISWGFTNRAVGTIDVIEFEDSRMNGFSVTLDKNQKISIKSPQDNRTYQFTLDYYDLEKDNRGFMVYSYEIVGESNAYLRIYDLTELKKDERFSYFDQGEEYLMVVFQDGKEFIKFPVIPSYGRFDEYYVNKFSSNTSEKPKTRKTYTTYILFEVVGSEASEVVLTDNNKISFIVDGKVDDEFEVEFDEGQNLDGTKVYVYKSVTYNLNFKLFDYSKLDVEQRVKKWNQEGSYGILIDFPNGDKDDFYLELEAVDVQDNR